MAVLRHVIEKWLDGARKYFEVKSIVSHLMLRLFVTSTYVIHGALIFLKHNMEMLMTVLM